MKSIKLPILFNTDDTSTLNDLDIDYDLNKCEIRDIIFFDINYIHKRTDNRTTIGSNGELFICSLSVNEIETMIYIVICTI